VVQEIVVATKLEVMCGDDSIPWSLITYIWPEFFAAHFKKAQGMCRRLAPHYYESTILPVVAWHRTNIDLSYALRLTASSRATDARDRVYAILGLVDKGAGQHIIADYTIAPCTVLLGATYALIRDWNNDEAAIRVRKLEDILSQISEIPKFQLHSKDYRVRARTRSVRGCKAVVHLHQYVRFLLGVSDHLDVDMPTSDTGLSSCDGEKCGSWVAMYKAANIQEEVSLDRPWGWFSLGLELA
jgi:hypothetical protein